MAPVRAAEQFAKTFGLTFLLDLPCNSFPFVTVCSQLLCLLAHVYTVLVPDFTPLTAWKLKIGNMSNDASLSRDPAIRDGKVKLRHSLATGA